MSNQIVLKAVIGNNGVNLVGDLIKYDSTFGNRIEYNESFVIGTTTTTPTEDEEEVVESTPSDNKYVSEQDVYNFMKFLYDQLTNYEENYVREVHDSQVAIWQQINWALVFKKPIGSM